MPSIAQIPVSSSIIDSPPSGKKRKREQQPAAYGDGEDSMIHNIIQQQHTSPNAPFTASARLMLKPRPFVKSHLHHSHETKRQRVISSLLSEQGTRQDLTNTIASTTTTLPQDEVYHAGGADGNGNGNGSGLGTDPYQAQHGSIWDPAPSRPARREEQGAVERGFARRPAPATTTTSSTDLRPCHICHQKPKVRTDLDSYGDCEGCGARTCYICMRECLGPLVVPVPLAIEALVEGGNENEMGRGDGMAFMMMGGGGERHPLGGEGAGEWTSDERTASGSAWDGGGKGRWGGHKDMVCSRCCVERGVDGEVRCLSCLRAEEAESGM